MKIYLLIKPQDYQSADVEIFTDLNEAVSVHKQARKDKEKNSENWVIREEEI